MSFRIEQPRCLAHLRATRAPGAQAEDRPALAREGGRWRATHFGMRLCRCIQRPITLPPEYRPAAELSNLVSLKHNIDLIMATATPISRVKQGTPVLLSLALRWLSSFLLVFFGLCFLLSLGSDLLAIEPDCAGLARRQFDLKQS